MKKNTNIYSKIDSMVADIISAIVVQFLIPYDQATRSFQNSITYQLLYDISTELYLCDKKSILEMWEHEVKMDDFLDQVMKKTNNKMINATQEKMKKQLKKEALSTGLPIEEVYSHFTTSKKKKNINSFPRKKVKTLD